MRELLLEDQRFGRLTVVDRSDVYKLYPSGQKIFKWNCICECGNSTKVSSQMLRSGRTRSCGCLQREIASTLGQTTRKQGTAARTYYSSTRQAALRRNYEFGLSFNDYYRLTQLPCVYCNVSPNGKYISKSGEAFIYNGIDRLNNSIGYTKDNSVSCCWNCNRMKGTLTVAEFIGQCKKILETVGLT